MGPASLCKEFKEAVRTVNKLVEDDEFIDLGLDDLPVCEASDDSLECLSPCAIKIVNDGKGKKITSGRDENLDDTVQEKMADIVGNLSYSLCCEEFVNYVRERFMRLGSQAPLGELLSLCSYGRAFSRTDGPSFRVRWSDDRETVSWADGKICLCEFRLFTQRSMDSADALLCEMMYGLYPTLDLSRLHDDISVTKQGYSFVQGSCNNLAKKYLELPSQACLDSENGLMSGESWNSKAVRHYLDQDHELLKQLGLIMYLSRGQAPRSTELFSIECENSPATSRGLYIHDGALCYVTRYSKSRQTTNEEFQVACYLPSCASQVLVTYLVYVRLFVAMLRRICVGQGEASRLLFRCPYRSDTLWKADVLTKALRVHT
jgi:hypothetical protein